MKDIERHLADCHFCWIGGTGPDVHRHSTDVVHDKAQMIAHMVANPRRVAERTPRVRVYGDVGLLTGEMTNVNPMTRDQVRLFVTQVARRSEDGWRFVSFHATRT